MEGRRWEDLSIDVLIFIFSKLGLVDLTVGVALVCKSFHEASLDPECWKTLDFHDLDFSPNSNFIARLMQEYHFKVFSFSSLLKLCFARSNGLATKLSIPYIIGSPLLPSLILASNQCPRLKALTLPILFPQNVYQIPGLIGKWKELETLELNWKPISFLKIVEEIKAKCPKFTDLRLSGIIDDQDANAIVNNLPSLKSLAITSSFLKIEDLVTILDGCGELQAVDVSWCTGFEGDDEMLKRFSARIKDFVSDGCRVQDSYVNWVWVGRIAVLRITLICGGPRVNPQMFFEVFCNDLHEFLGLYNSA